MKPNILARWSVVASVLLTTVGLSACSAPADQVAPSYMSLGDLQVNVANRLAAAGARPDSVRCDDGLVAQVGKTTKCYVKFTAGNDSDPGTPAVITVTGVDETDVTFDLAPTMSRPEVEATVARIAGVPAAKCDTGLDGQVGASTRCSIAPGEPVPMMDSGRIAEVAKIDLARLSMELAVFSLIPKQQLQDLFMQRLFADGLFPQTVECAGDVATKRGSSVECAVVSDGPRLRYDVTVAPGPDGFIGLDYKAKP